MPQPVSPATTQDRKTTDSQSENFASEETFTPETNLASTSIKLPKDIQNSVQLLQRVENEKTRQLILGKIQRERGNNYATTVARELQRSRVKSANPVNDNQAGFDVVSPPIIAREFDEVAATEIKKALAEEGASEKEEISDTPSPQAEVPSAPKLPPPPKLAPVAPKPLIKAQATFKPSKKLPNQPKKKPGLPKSAKNLLPKGLQIAAKAKNVSGQKKISGVASSLATSTTSSTAVTSPPANLKAAFPKIKPKAKPLSRLPQLVQQTTTKVGGFFKGVGLPQKSTETTVNALPLQRAVAECAPPPPPPAPKSPENDAKFQQIKGKAKQAAGQEKSHPSPQSKAAEAQNAAKGPSNDVSSQAAATQVGKMGEQQPGTFNKAAFIAALNQAIQALTPQTQEQVADFKKSGKAGELKEQVNTVVGQNKDGARKDIQDNTKAAPDSSQAKPKEVSPMQPEKAGETPGAIGAANAMPQPKSAAETSLASGPCEVDSKMEAAKVTDEQLQKSNEPEFNKALESKSQLQENAKTAPQQFREQEQGVLNQARTDSEAKATQTLGGMHDNRANVLTQVDANKETAKTGDEAKRAEVSTNIENIYNKTKEEVTGILDALDAKVNDAFDNGEKAARAAFENLVETETKAFNDKRYSGLLGWGQWVIDKFTSPPPELNAIYQRGRNQYLKQMNGVIDRVADVVGGELNRAKARIGQGLQEVKKYVASLPKDLREVGEEAQEKIKDKFDELEQNVENKQNDLVDSLAQKYVEARNSVDERIAKMQEENKGLLDRAKDAVGGVIETIINLKNMLTGVLSKAAGVIEKIIKDPIGFLSNLVSAVGQGLKNFGVNIAKHLQQGLMGWLFGALGQAGIQMPETLDFKGILSLVLQVMGLTYQNIRMRAVKIVGEKTVSRIEQVASFFKMLISEGPIGIWKHIQEFISNLPDLIMNGIKDFLINKVIMAGLTWIISLLNPASAFIKACKAIYDIVIFFVERGSQIMELVNAVLDSISAIANGSLGGAAAMVENALAKALPVAISFLASLLGLGGISEKIKKIIQSVQKPVNSAIDFVIKKTVNGFKKLSGKFKKGTDWVKGKAKGISDKIKGKDRSPEKKDEDLKKGMAAGVAAVNKYSGKKVGNKVLKPLLAVIKLRYRLTSLEPVERGKNWAVRGEIARAEDQTKALVSKDDEDKWKQIEQLNNEIPALFQNIGKLLEGDKGLKNRFAAEINNLHDEWKAAEGLIKYSEAKSSAGSIVEEYQKINKSVQSLQKKVEEEAKKAKEQKLREMFLGSKTNHTRASNYSGGKHVKGNTNKQREENATTGRRNGQYFVEFNDDKIIQLEREALEKGEIKDREGSYHIFYSFPFNIGYASGGSKTNTIRAEWSSGSVHSHPR